MKNSHWLFTSRKSLRPHEAEQTAAADRLAREPATQRRSVLLAYFDAWRDAADHVEAASRRWRAASGRARTEAALAFFAALDREEKAAAEYQLAWEA